MNICNINNEFLQFLSTSAPQLFEAGSSWLEADVEGRVDHGARHLDGQSHDQGFTIKRLLNQNLRLVETQLQINYMIPLNFKTFTIKTLLKTQSFKSIFETLLFFKRLVCFIYC